MHIRVWRIHVLRIYCGILSVCSTQMAKGCESVNLDLWKVRMCDIRFLKECEYALESEKPATLRQPVLSYLNKNSNGCDK